MKKSFLGNYVEFLIYFRSLSDIFLDFGRKLFLQGCQNWIIRVQRNFEPFEEKYRYFSNCFGTYIRSLSKKFSDFWQKFPARAFKIALILQKNIWSESTFFEKSFFWFLKFQRKIDIFSEKSYWEGARSTNLQSRCPNDFFVTNIFLKT